MTKRFWMKNTEKKNITKRLRMTETEAKDLDDLLEQTDLNFSQLVRKGITDLKAEINGIEKKKAPKKTSKIDKAALLELGRVGNNINQIAKSLNILKNQQPQVDDFNYFQCLCVLKEMRDELQNVVVQLPKTKKNDD